jgi:predicted nucleic acid-binding protein
MRTRDFSRAGCEPGTTHRDHCAVSLADCLAAAAALSEERPLATSDPALAAVVRSEGGTVHALSDSTGVKP